MPEISYPGPSPPPDEVPPFGGMRVAALPEATGAPPAEEPPFPVREGADGARGVPAATKRGWSTRRIALTAGTAAVALALTVGGALLLGGGGGGTRTAPTTVPVASTVPAPTTTATGGTTTAPIVAPASQPLARSSVVAAEASSTLPDDPAAGATYGVANTLDGNVQTAWSHQGTTGSDGVGQRLRYRFDRPYDLVSMVIVNGYGKSEDLYLANERLTRVRITTDTVSRVVDLDGGLGAYRMPQAVAGPWGVTSTVTIDVLGVQPGSRHTDLVVSEVTFDVK